MSTGTWLSDRLDHWLTIEQPVTYWSFWRALLRLVPLLAVPFVVVLLVAGDRIALLSFAPVPFVLVAATLGYAVRSFDGVGALISGVVGVVYGFLLWLEGTGELLVFQATPMLAVLTVLTFLAVIAGFASPTLHGRGGDDEFERARREWEDD